MWRQALYRSYCGRPQGNQSDKGKDWDTGRLRKRYVVCLRKTKTATNYHNSSVGLVKTPYCHYDKVSCHDLGRVCVVLCHGKLSSHFLCESKCSVVNQVTLCDLTEWEPNTKIPQWVYESPKEDFNILYTGATQSQIITLGEKR